MKVRMLYFAAARELAACADEELTHTSHELALSQFVCWLGERQPRLAPYLARMRFAINGELANMEARVHDGDEVVVLPPVAGGIDHERADVFAEVRSDALSLDELVARVRHDSAGAIALFMGVVRDHHAGKPVQRLDYESYRELAEKEMRAILRELVDAHPGSRVACVHRVGELAVGDLAVIVAASSAHRDAAFTICRSAIDRIKATVPIWKKEWSTDGSALWVNLESDERT
ncbi:MAG: MoaD family protein [Myxococcaceae bacterium]|nr:MoaD family protein [Myxococcaceae bacterium]